MKLIKVPTFKRLGLASSVRRESGDVRLYFLIVSEDAGLKRTNGVVLFLDEGVKFHQFLPMLREGFFS